MKKKIALLLAAVMSLGICGCSGNTAEDDAVPTITWLVPGDDQPGLESVLAEANKIVEEKITEEPKKEEIISEQPKMELFVDDFENKTLTEPNESFKSEIINIDVKPLKKPSLFEEPVESIVSKPFTPKENDFVEDKIDVSYFENKIKLEPIKDSTEIDLLKSFTFASVPSTHI